jgi:SAM-dependent methyltransferase
VPADRIIPLYERNAAAWDAARGGTLHVERAWLDRFAAAARPGGTVLDLGCGTGEPIAGALLARGFGVTGVDAAPTLIALARERLPAGEWVVADMRTLALGRRFDAVLAWHSFFHLAPDDQRAMFSVFAAHAAPDAPLMFTSGPEAGEAIGEWEGEPLYHASLAPAEYRALLAAHGFAELAHVANDATCGGATVWLARREA